MKKSTLVSQGYQQKRIERMQYSLNFKELLGDEERVKRNI